jgi:hypothetical protein
LFLWLTIVLHFNFHIKHVFGTVFCLELVFACSGYILQNPDSGLQNQAVSILFYT